jgi:Cu2+-exporting ATPase
VILGLAILTAVFWSVSRGWEVSVERTVSLLTIACPCALALAAPLVITVAIGRAAKEKIWIRDGNSLERLAKPGLMCLDKTGTLTFGDLRVIDWSGPKELLMSIARIELESEHPVARALVVTVVRTALVQLVLLILAVAVVAVATIGVQEEPVVGV